MVNIKTNVHTPHRCDLIFYWSIEVLSFMDINPYQERLVSFNRNDLRSTCKVRIFVSPVTTLNHGEVRHEESYAKCITQPDDKH